MNNYDIPSVTKYEYELGDTGAAVYSIQLAFNDLMQGREDLYIDGEYGQKTKTRALQFQKKYELFEDGVFGPSTSTKVAKLFCRKTEEKTPKNMLRSVVEGESGNLIGAVNWTVSGGVDCGYVQRRLSLPTNDTMIKIAWDSKYQIETLSDTLKNFRDQFINKPAVDGNNQKAWRLAVLNHNWPYGAWRLSHTRSKDLTPYWTEDAPWVMQINAHFNDGDLVKTPLDWAKFYSLGSKKHNHNGNMVKYVKSWNI